MMSKAFFHMRFCTFPSKLDISLDLLRSKMSPRTGMGYSDDLRLELARNSSAEAQSFFSISVWFAGIYKTSTLR